MAPIALTSVSSTGMTATAEPSSNPDASASSSGHRYAVRSAVEKYHSPARSASGPTFSKAAGALVPWPHGLCCTMRKHGCFTRTSRSPPAGAALTFRSVHRLSVHGLPRPVKTSSTDDGSSHVAAPDRFVTVYLSSSTATGSANAATTSEDARPRAARRPFTNR